MAIDPLAVYRVVTDPNLSADAKKSQIDLLYSAGAPPDQTPDMRTADVTETAPDPTAAAAAQYYAAADTSPTPPPVASDVPAPSPGALSSMPASVAPPAAASIAPAPPPPGANMSSASSGAPIAAPAPVVPPASAEVADVASPPVDDDARVSAGIRMLAQGAMRGTPARRIAAYDQPTASVTEHANTLPDDVKQAVADDAAKEGELAVQQGEDEAKSHLDMALGADIQARDARSQAAKLAADNAALQAHAAKLDDEFVKLTKDTAVRPEDWWASKSTAGKVTSLIGAVLFGLASSPDGLQRVMEQDLAARQANRDKMLGALKDKVNAFHSRLMTPEAQHAAEQALAAQAVAAESTRMAEAAKAPEARMRGLQLAQQFQTQYHEWAARMAAAEAGSIKTNIAHVPERVVGGAADPIATLERLHKLGLDTPEVIKTIMGGTYGTGASPDEGKRRVTFADGHVGYVANEEQQKDTQETVSALGRLKSAYGRILQLSKSPGHTLAGKERAEIEANVALATQQLQSMAKGEGANARMAGEMLERLGPLVGDAALKTGTLDATARAQLQEAYRLAAGQEESIKDILTPSNKTAPSGGKIQTLGASKEAVGFEGGG
ncbi:MAG TPA: hypothetical protein VHC69_12760 [Polyangiaceae bacterium]|nr:hypothetical protein [Polyangiaceae bacterium]